MLNHWPPNDALTGNCRRFCRHFAGQRRSVSEERRWFFSLVCRSLEAVDCCCWWNKLNSSPFFRIICSSASEWMDTSSNRDRSSLLCRTFFVGIFKLFFRFMQDFLKLSPKKDRGQWDDRIDWMDSFVTSSTTLIVQVGWKTQLLMMYGRRCCNVRIVGHLFRQLILGNHLGIATERRASAVRTWSWWSRILNGRSRHHHVVGSGTIATVATAGNALLTQDLTEGIAELRTGKSVNQRIENDGRFG